jgi:hypothetical protein
VQKIIIFAGCNHIRAGKRNEEKAQSELFLSGFADLSAKVQKIIEF